MMVRTQSAAPPGSSAAVARRAAGRPERAGMTGAGALAVGVARLR